MNARLLSASAAAILAVSATTAYAQDGDYFLRNRNTGVRDRPRPDYEALGIGQGGLRLLPQATATVGYDDNIYASSTNEISDVITTLSGEAALISDWNVHQIGGTARVRHDFYADTSAEDATTYNLSGFGRLDATRDISFNGAVSYDGLVEPRTASGNPSSSVNPIEFTVQGIDAGTVITFNKLRLRGDLFQRDYDYENGRTAASAIIDQSFRNEKTLRGVLRADYAISPDTSLFIQGALDKRDYDPNPNSLIIRDSEGSEINVGADFDITNLIRGSVQAGYLEQNYDSPLLNDTTGLSGRIAVEYFPTELATVTFRADRAVRDTGLTTASTYLASDYSVQIDYELLRNIILTARVTYGDDEYQGLSRKDERMSTTLSGVYLLNRRWGLGANYNYAKQDSTGLDAGIDYEVHRISASLTLQY